ncbi:MULTISPECIES: competence type IV pilus ATPase ComGA [unclassified Granulicatella]|uniref:competence type IV pilus ATPase ComGA n=1 Tax=unclassified Granulicatella TaxID=2630493 RepID=UPI0010742BF2|nr:MULTISPECIES: competence type IV pilus ATPase ComGA [unclassified Granulicatella]MBF0780551.1 Flp pilus assembly complex ATPase component TadA [Granulicatella sp. 19428wC4_WM01]TFU94905.1 general secretion pathway protein GspE [Granulicatella sp. WM01]
MIEQFAEKMLMAALDKHISDIHITPLNTSYHIYFRYLDKLVLMKRVSYEYGQRLIAYFKYGSRMSVGEKRKPQSGAMRMSIHDCHFEVRTSTISNFLSQESMVIRLLKMKRELSTLPHFFPKEVEKLYHLLQRKQGLIIFAGPVDSGKTSTVHYLLRRLYDEKATHILTLEDPVEITDDRFLQTEINEAAGIDYDILIKASLRHHPDILVIGEIRDVNTAKMAIRATLTGHLVIATIHAKSSIGVVERLKDLSISDNLIYETLTGVVSQRLLPRYCALCQDDCQLFCQHIPFAQKRLALTDIVSIKYIRHYFLKDYALNGFNKQLKRAYAMQFISKRCLEEYWIDE